MIHYNLTTIYLHPFAETTPALVTDKNYHPNEDILKVKVDTIIW